MIKIFFSFRVFVLILSLMFGVSAYSRPKVLTFLPPIASLISMIGGDKIQLEVITTNSGCVHEHHLKPSEVKKILSADLIILLNNNFDGKILHNFTESWQKIFYLDNKHNLKLATPHSKADPHVWLNIDHAVTILNGIYLKLVELNPSEQLYFEDNLKQSIAQLKILKEQLQSPVPNLHDALSLSPSLKYFFQNFKTKPEYYLIGPKLTFKDIKNLQNLSQQKKYKCLILDEEQSPERFKDIFKDIPHFVQLNTEHWNELKIKDLRKLYINALKANHQLLHKCN